MRPLISSFLLGESTQLQKGNLSGAERGLSEKGTKFVFCRFYCHIADWPLPRGQNLLSVAHTQRSAHRVYVRGTAHRMLQAASDRQQRDRTGAPSRTPVPSSPRPRRDCLHAERTDWAVDDVSGAVGQAVLARGCCSTRIRGAHAAYEVWSCSRDTMAAPSRARRACRGCALSAPYPTRVVIAGWGWGRAARGGLTHGALITSY
jgi:hypothetical protein